MDAIFFLQQLPDFPRRVSGSGEMLPPQLGIAFGHLDIRVAKDFRQLVKIAAVHPVPGCKGVAQIVETKVLNFCPCEQVVETSFNPLPSTYRTRLWRKNPMLRNCDGKPPQLAPVQASSEPLAT